MKWQGPSRIPLARCARRIVVSTAIASMILPGIPAGAQTRSVRDTVTAYGARLDAKGEPANLNPNRVNNRINSRLDTRLSLRIERYRPDIANDPAAAFAVRPTDNARIGTGTTPSLPSAPRSMSRASEESSSQSSPAQVSPARTDASPEPR